MEAKPVKMRLHFFNSAVITNSKLDYLCVLKTKKKKGFARFLISLNFRYIFYTLKKRVIYTLNSIKDNCWKVNSSHTRHRGQATTRWLNLKTAHTNSKYNMPT